jgi:D-lactate dehydrogenase
MKIGFFELETWEKDTLEKAFPKDQVILSHKKFTLKEAAKYPDLEVISVFIYSPIDEKMLEKLPRLKMISTRSTGYDHLKLDACRKRNIVVCNVPTYGENTVAEHTFSLILALSRKIIECHERTRSGSFEVEGLRGFDLKGKTLGVVGSGNIGRHVIRMAHGFEMNLLVYDAFPNPQTAKDLNFTYVSMDQLLKNSDIITLHIPYNEKTHHFINKAAFEKMKKGAYLVNTSRGGIVDTDALVKALKSKKLAGAGLDVLEGECDLLEERQLISKDFSPSCDMKTLVEDHILMVLPNVIVTPHNAFNTHEALMRILQTTVASINGFKSNNLVNVVK